MNELEKLKSVKRLLKLAVKDLLSGKTEAGDRVFISRTIPVDDEIDDPVILIYTTSEAIDQFNESIKNYRRRLNMVIECIVGASTDDELDDLFESIGEKVEALMELDQTFGGLANRIYLTSADYQEEASAKNPMGSLILQFSIEFFTDAIREGLELLDNFNEVKIKYDLQHDKKPLTDEIVIDANDTVNLDEEE